MQQVGEELDAVDQPRPGPREGRGRVDREDAARAQRLRLICLETGVYQPEALGLFAHHGFARCRHFGDYPPDDPLSLFMDKRL